MSGASVALVGGYQQDNLALGYLASYAELKGHRAEIIQFDHARDTARCVKEILAMNPDAVGLGISFHYAIGDYLALADALREQGYRGHITCGGHVPTFCYRELLTASSAIDTAVRHEGEETLVALLDALKDAEAPRGLAGLVWREAGEIRVGSPRPFLTELDRLPWPKRRETPFTTTGIPLSFMITSRGCIGDCAYCVIRAFSKDAGGPRYRMRAPESVAAEAAALRRETGARITFLEDDLFILPSEKKSIARMRALKSALEAEDVHDLIFWTKARPESITVPVLEAAKALGVAHIFLGVEQASLPRLRYLGRKHTPEDNVRAISLTKEYGIRPSFNIMLFDPDCTMAEVKTAIDFAGDNLDLSWNICRTEIYPGTRIFEKLKEAHRLVGDFMSYGYKMADTRAELMFRIMRVSFYNRAFNFDSVLNRLGTLVFSTEAHLRLIPGPTTTVFAKKALGLLTDINRDTVRRLRDAWAFSMESGLDEVKKVQDFAMDLAMDMNEEDHRRLDELEQLSRKMATSAAHQPPGTA